MTSILFGSTAYAQIVNCDVAPKQRFDKMICQSEVLKQLQNDVHEKYLMTQLMSNAPLSLVQYSQNQWLKFTKLCKTQQCITRQFEQRIDDLTLMSNLNQSFSQHFIRYRGNLNSKQMTTLQLHQMGKNKIKIEGIQYRNPNNSESARIAYLRSYTSSNLSEPITDLESRCVYQLIRTKYSLTFQSEDEKCQRFVGMYKLYD